MTKKILLGLLSLFILIQFFRPSRNLSTAPEPDEIFSHYPASESIKAMIKTSCYDCHSNNSRYPWYTYIQPIAWITAHHIEEGKRELNFSEFGTYSLKKSNHKLEEVEETVHQREMPIKSYSQLHPEADLTDNEKNLLIMWSKDLRSNLLK